MPRFAPYIFILAAVFMCSCGSDDDACYPDRNDISFRADYRSLARTTITGTTAAFKSGDKIGITETLTARSNVLYSFNGTAWSTSSTMYWKNRTSTHTFYAYYPYSSASSGTSAVVPVLNNQASAEKVDPSCDMLVAAPKTQVRQTGGTSVTLTFRHAFAMLQFNIYTSILSTVYLNNMTVKGGNTSLSAGKPYGIVNTVNATGNIYYDQVNSTIRFPVNSSATFAQSVTKSVPSNTLINLSGFSAYMLVMPGEFENPKPQVSFNLTGLGTITTKFAELSVSQFQPGTKYVFKVTIPSGLLSVAAGPPGVAGAPHGSQPLWDPALNVGLESVEPW